MKNYTIIIVLFLVLAFPYESAGQTSGATALEVTSFEPVDTTDLVTVYTGEGMSTSKAISSSFGLTTIANVSQSTLSGDDGSSFSIRAPMGIISFYYGFGETYIKRSVISSFYLI